MKRSVSIVLCILSLCALTFAHGDMEHVLGSVTEVTDHSISVKTADGSVKVVAFDSETHFLKGGQVASIKDVVVGSRVVIHAHKHGDALHAAEVKIGVSASASAHP